MFYVGSVTSHIAILQWACSVSIHTAAIGKHSQQCSPPVMVDTDCQFDVIQSFLEDKVPGTPVNSDLEYINWRKKPHSECG